MNSANVKHPALAACPVVVEIPVAWGEMDAFQHVNNVAYFRYFETARIAYFEQIALLELRESTGIGPILASTRCRYRLPLTYPDTLDVGARVADLGSDRFTMHYTVVSRRHGRAAAEGDGVLVAYDYRSGSKTIIPPVLRERILALEGPSPIH